MSSKRNRQTTFRPTLANARLEERVVLSRAGTTVGGIPFSMLPNTGVAQPPAANQPFSPGETIGVLGKLRGPAATRMIQASYLRQVRAASNDLRQEVNALSTQLYRNGPPTAQQLADFNASVAGAVNATALRLSAQAALLPRGSTQLVPNIQSGLLGNGPNSLVSRLQAAALGDTSLSDRGLQNALGRQINNAFRAATRQLNQFFRTTPLTQLSVDSTTGQRIPLGQYLGNQLVSQFGNTMASFSQAVGSYARSNLFANGVTAPTSQAQSAFMSQFTQGLGTAAFQLGSGLALFNNASNGLIPQLQNSFFGTGANSFMNQFQNVPFTSAGFGAASTNAFNTGFRNFAGPLSNFFSLDATRNQSLPTGQISGIFGQQFGGFGNGFNSGFGTGFPGFGTPSNGFNPNFATGFNNQIGLSIPSFGFNIPSFANTPGLSPSGRPTTF
ncbi:MAG: hypothetical protein NVSMB9_03990 [Isosphaeraceae bacterium]